MDSFSIIDLILLIGIGQGVFLAVSIAQIRESNRLKNNYVIQAVLLATLMLVGKVFAPRFQGDWVIRVSLLSDTSIFLFGPLIYAYINSLLNTDSTFRLRSVHYLPALVHLVYFFLSFSLPVEEFLRTMYSQFGFILVLIEFAGLVSLISYWLASILLVKKRKSEKNFSNEKDISDVTSYIAFFLSSIGLLSLFWLISFMSLYVFRKPIALVTYNMMWIITPVFFYVIGFFSLKYPHILRIKRRKVEDRLSEKQIVNLNEKIDLLMHEETIYKDPDLTLKTLAEKLGTSSNNLSWLLNHVHKKSFYDFTNQIRIDAFQNKIENKEHLNRTLLSLAMEVGFKSKSTFNKSFKDYMKVTPKEYVKNTAISH